MVPALVLLLCLAVVVVGALAELGDTVRARRAPALVPGPEGLEQRPDMADVGRWPTVSWLGLAAFTVLVPMSALDRRPDVDDVTIVVLMLGFAGERAFYLLRRRRSGDGQVLGVEVLSHAVAAIGLLVGVTL